MRWLLRLLILGIILTSIILIFNLSTKWGCGLAVILAFGGDELLKKIKLLRDVKHKN